MAGECNKLSDKIEKTEVLSHRGADISEMKKILLQLPTESSAMCDDMYEGAFLYMKYISLALFHLMASYMKPFL